VFELTTNLKMAVPCICKVDGITLEVALQIVTVDWLVFGCVMVEEVDSSVIVLRWACLG
jgi:hypothetical protein